VHAAGATFSLLGRRDDRNHHAVEEVVGNEYVGGAAPRDAPAVAEHVVDENDPPENLETTNRAFEAAWPIPKGFEASGICWTYHEIERIMETAGGGRRREVIWKMQAKFS
jgi:hypothetical protein